MAFWEDFLQFLNASTQKAPILLSVLKQAKPITIEDGQIIVGCENQGVRFFLEKRKGEIEKKLRLFAKKDILLSFTLSEIKKKKSVSPPLLSFQPSIQDVFTKSGLHVKYSFDNFAVSSSNQVAHAAASAVSNNLATAYNPLFLYGGVGVGKTHLAQSVGKKILEKDGSKKVFFCPGDQFTNELIDSIRERTTARFRAKYRKLSLLIVDDIQFIAGKQLIQEEFFHTFNSIVSVGGQIILTSDRPPGEIKNLEDRLRSRFSGGLIVDIQSPDFELRTAILLIKAKEKNIEIEMEAAKAIAEQINDTRALEGALLSIYAKILGIKERIDLDSVEAFFSEKTERVVKKISPTDVLKLVCSYYNVKQSHLKGPNRTENLVIPRQLTMFILRNTLRLKLEEIARVLKRKDHTTVIYAVNKIGRLLVKDPIFKQDVDRITQSLSSST
ncbi:chromosomal replication initiator protein DnaA [Candidatus Roizmanbacteria bacterium CG09_land_8_20_14_0_10_41_9]|uniref:Chromosomal replication initiator protein DnaA n=1 Tax=Candidatus Roizmanbacteria bacterium CG09_land_8_20_14_0_10_41_9 TaxID=1974850 RepID=A0A2H0WS65_9BACT|nr:MAG: chromosomal replication initiator protein DnaA [Candidatus Roizmanbacteria bacterium CG09_land_8_20_14_0_10_41_9]